MIPAEKGDVARAFIRAALEGLEARRGRDIDDAVAAAVRAALRESLASLGEPVRPAGGA